MRDRDSIQHQIRLDPDDWSYGRLDLDGRWNVSYRLDHEGLHITANRVPADTPKNTIRPTAIPHERSDY
jgi:hypothetical protein